MKVYLARKMTGLTGKQLVAKSVCARTTAAMLFPGKFELLDPVAEENVPATDDLVAAPAGLLSVYWKRDKEMIRQAHVLIDMTGPEKSEGVSHEIGYARYLLWKPVIRVYENLGPSVARIEDDAIACCYEEALKIAYELWGTKTKRIVWRLKMLNRCLLQWLKFQVEEFK